MYWKRGKLAKHSSPSPHNFRCQLPHKSTNLFKQSNTFLKLLHLPHSFGNVCVLSLRLGGNNFNPKELLSGGCINRLGGRRRNNSTTSTSIYRRNTCRCCERSKSVVLANGKSLLLLSPQFRPGDWKVSSIVRQDICNIWCKLRITTRILSANP